MSLLYILLLIPLASLLIGFALSNKNEKAIYLSSFISVAINAAALIIIFILWVKGGFNPVVLEGPVIFQSTEAELAIRLYLDGYGLVYLFLATYLTGIIIVFSKNYIHREKGYKRFFNNIKFFYFGLLVVLLANNLELIFIGWEVIGVTSFFLIGFYRDRYLPVKNALKVVSLYRVADIALLLAIWLSHHYFGHSISFSSFDGMQSPMHHILNEDFYLFALPTLLLIAAMVKSAQFPFSSWLPRAMEGPTTSSAIFYGSLYVHIGVFLLIRVSPFWEGNIWFHFIIAGVGLLTFIVSFFTARVQATIKTKIAYSSLAQIGLMFIELSLGLYWLTMIHVVSNALYRSHQLLISPSVLSHRIHEQVFHFKKPKPQGKDGLWNKVKISIYVLSIKEFNLDSFMFSFLWSPLKKLGNGLNFISTKATFILGVPLFLTGLFFVYHTSKIDDSLLKYMPEFFAGVGLILILKSFVERKSAMSSWLMIVLNQLFLSLAFGYNERFDFNQVHIFLSGITVSALLGIWIIHRIKQKNKDTSLDQFHGHNYEFPRLAFLFVIAALGLAGFPITPTFIGEDLMLGHIEENQFLLLALVTLNLVLDGLVIFRIYSRLFLGQHKSGYHEFAYRSS